MVSKAFPTAISKRGDIGLSGLLWRLTERFGLCLLMGTLCVLYAYFFVESISSYWFNPRYTTDDALQQIFPFNEVVAPGVFQGDLIYETMKGYLAPLHYWICYAITYCTGDPIMMGHWVMLIQLSLSVLFVFLAVNRLTGSVVPAFFSVAWLLHTRNIMQRLTAGLPRGWAAPILLGFLYFVVSKNHKGVLLTLLAGCLLNPPATVIAAVAYGILLLWRVAQRSTRAEYKKALISYLLLCPVYLVVTLAVIHRAPEVGQMVTKEIAASMPEFDDPGGRFPFLPMKAAWDEIRVFGTQTFVTRWYNPGPFLRANMAYIVIGLFALLAAFGALKRKVAVPAELTIFIASVFLVYFASREFAFRLYVPNRHLQFPIGIFIIVALPTAIWRLFSLGSNLARGWRGFVGLTVLAIMIYVGSSHGLKGAANFNYSTDKRGRVFKWLHENTPETSLIAGNPTHIDPIQLFSGRRGYATTETAHPFYLGYYNEIERRLIISWQANYARTLKEMLEILEPEGINYFVFRKADFYPDALGRASYFKPLNLVVEELTARPYPEYAYRELPAQVDLEHYPFMVFKDHMSVVIDLAKLRKYLAEQSVNHG